MRYGGVSQLAQLARSGRDEHEVVRSSRPPGKASAQRPSGDSAAAELFAQAHGRRAVQVLRNRSWSSL